MAETIDPYSSAVYAPAEQIAYEGASISYKSAQRGLLTGEADSLAARELLTLQMRSNHAIRNNGYAKTAITRYKQGETHVARNQLRQYSRWLADCIQGHQYHLWSLVS